jgi:tetratricopeptide (TPR) repeat protein
MRPRHELATLLLLLAPALVAAPVVAWGDGGASGGSKKKGDAAAAKTSDHGFQDACAAGNAKYASRDFDGAIDSYRKAIELFPHKALGHYLLGEAQLAANNLAEAEASWGRAALEANEQDPTMRARILFVTADLKERQKKWDEAKAAWQVYIDWANRYADAGAFPTSGTSRIQAIDAMLKQDKAYEIVRQRIEETRDGGVYTELPKGPDATKGGKPAAK